LRAKIAQAVQRGRHDSGGVGPSTRGGPKQRTVLALLLQNANELVARERLVAAVWGKDAPPESAARVRAHVARLRQRLARETDGSATIETQRAGYVLRTDSETQQSLADRIAFSLRPPSPAPRPAVRPRAARRVLALATVATLALGAAVAAGSPKLSSSSSEHGNSVVAIDSRTGSVLGGVQVGGRPGGIAVGRGTIWVGNRDAKALLRIGTRQWSVVQTIGIGVEPIGVASGGGSVWVLGSEGTVLKVDPMLGRVVATITGPASRRICCPQDIAFARGSLWVVQGGSLTRIEADTQRAVRTGFRNVRSIASSGTALWGVLGTGFERFRQLKPLGGALRVDGVDGIGRLGGIGAAQGSLWTASATNLRGISPRTGRVKESLSLSRPIVDLAVSPGGVVWVALGER
jgi:DNA-binding winged helix-turn-helix (wHTH) protein